jgi:hypothetical protein
MAVYKTITLKKRGGGTRKQRVKVLSSGKFQFVKNIKEKVKSTKKKVYTKKRVGRVLARKRSKKRRSSRKFTIPLAVVVPIGWKIWESVRHGVKQGNWTSATKDALWHFACIGYDEGGAGYHFNTTALKTWIPVIAGLLIHKFVGGRPLNLNKYLKDVPLVRV